MALVFPKVFPAVAGKPPREQALFDTLRAELDDEWSVFYDRKIAIGGQEGRFDFVLLHRTLGIAALAAVEADEQINEGAAIAAMRAFLEEHRFGEVFGSLPRVAAIAAVPPFAGLGDRIRARLAPPLESGPSDPDWAEWVADLLTVPDDLMLQAPPPSPPLIEDEQIFADVEPIGFRPLFPPSEKTEPAAAPSGEVMPDAASDQPLTRILGGMALAGGLFGALALAVQAGWSGQSVPGKGGTAIEAAGAAIPVPTATAHAAGEPEPSARSGSSTEPSAAEERFSSEHESAASVKEARQHSVRKIRHKRTARRRRDDFWTRLAKLFQ